MPRTSQPNENDPNPYDAAPIRAAIRANIEKSGLSVKAFEKAAGIADGRIGKFLREGGIRQATRSPGIDSMKKGAQHLGITVSEFIGETEPEGEFNAAVDAAVAKRLAESPSNQDATIAELKRQLGELHFQNAQLIQRGHESDVEKKALLARVTALEQELRLYLQRRRERPS